MLYNLKYALSLLGESEKNEKYIEMKYYLIQSVMFN